MFYFYSKLYNNKSIDMMALISHSHIEFKYSEWLTLKICEINILEFIPEHSKEFVFMMQ